MTSQRGRKRGFIDHERRARQHVGSAIAGMFASAAWSTLLLHHETVQVDAPRWWPLATLTMLSVIVVLGLGVGRTTTVAVLLDWICTGLSMALLAAWLHATGSLSSPLLAVSATLILAHFVTGGRALGLFAWSVGAGLHVLVALAEHARWLHYAPESAMPAAVLDTESFWPLLLSVLGVYAGTAWLGHELTGPKGRKRSPARQGRSGDEALLEGKYRLARPLGEGRHGRVFEGSRVADGQRVAIKILQVRMRPQPDVLIRFRRDADIAAGVPGHIAPRVLDVGTTRQGAFYIVMDLLEGENLAERLERVGAFSLDDAVGVAEGIAAALDAAAERGVVHRALKPRNVFLVGAGSAPPEVRLLDFGICELGCGAFGAAVTHSAALLGTPGFLAPEQVASGFGEVSARTDVFALGCILYEALSGRPAFSAEDAAGAVYESLNHQPPPLRDFVPNLPVGIESVLAVALAKQAADRYSSAGELASDLRALASGAIPAGVAIRSASASAARMPPTITSSSVT